MKIISPSFSRLHIFLFREAKPNEEAVFFLFFYLRLKLFQHLPPHSAEKHSLFRPRYKEATRLMNEERANNLRKLETQNSDIGK